MEKDIISILVVSKGKESSKYLHINVNHIKYFLFIFVSLISFTATSFFYHDDADTSINSPSVPVIAMAVEKEEKPNVDETTSEIMEDFLKLNVSGGDLKDGVPIEYQLSERLLEVEEKLKNMQSILKKKGIRKELSIGGEFIGADKFKEDYFDRIENDIENLTKTIQDYPIGMPSKGSISSYFGYRNDPFNKKRAFHSGLDLDSHYGDIVVSTASGSVEKAGWCQSYGKCVIIRHRDGYKTLYGHLSRIRVKSGEKITSGQTIGEIGSTGRSTGPHLHYEIRKNGKRINPYKYLTLG